MSRFLSELVAVLAAIAIGMVIMYGILSLFGIDMMAATF